MIKVHQPGKDTDCVPRYGLDGHDVWLVVHSQGVVDELGELSKDSPGIQVCLTAEEVGHLKDRCTTSTLSFSFHCKSQWIVPFALLGCEED